MINLYDYQKKAIDALKPGNILCGGVGSGKSLTALYFFYTKICGGKIDKNVVEPMKNPINLYIITTPRKRDTFEWERELSNFVGLTATVDSWNNIKKYSDVFNAFFIFDEQRVVGYGTWSKNFLKIASKNQWILLSATPGDTWMDYVPVFIANGFYRNKTEFVRNHVVYNNFTKFPKIDHYVNCDRLTFYRNKILVKMNYKTIAKKHKENVVAYYDEEKLKQITNKRWNPFTEEPIKDITEYCYAMRKVVNSSKHRLDIVMDIFKYNKKLIIFYNFDYELEALRTLKEKLNVPLSEWNGHKHEPIPDSDSWIFLVQYLSGAEGWNCIETDSMIFYSLNYSYKIMKQAEGRIDRLNTPFKDLYYYYIVSKSRIDQMIQVALNQKKNFNENTFVKYNS